MGRAPGRDGSPLASYVKWAGLYRIHSMGAPQDSQHGGFTAWGTHRIHSMGDPMQPFLLATRVLH